MQSVTADFIARLAISLAPGKNSHVSTSITYKERVPERSRIWYVETNLGLSLSRSLTNSTLLAIPTLSQSLSARDL